MKTSFITWNQRRQMYEPQNRFNRFLDGFTHRTRNSESPKLTVADCWRNQATVAKLPEVHVIREAHEYLLKADLPEVKKGDVTVTVEDNTLCVSGERKSEGADELRLEKGRS